MVEAVAETFFYTTNGFPKIYNIENKVDSWYEETLDDNLKWSFSLNSVLHKGTSEYQEMALLDTKHFGKMEVLVIDGKMQSAETDEFIYHENLIHPPLLSHPNPKSVFIMGGSEGSAAREALKHKSIEKLLCVISTRLRCITVDVTSTLIAYKGELGDYYCMADKSVGLPCPDYKRMHEGFKIAYTDMAKQYPCFGMQLRCPTIYRWYENTFRSSTTIGSMTMSRRCCRQRRKYRPEFAGSNYIIYIAITHFTIVIMRILIEGILRTQMP
ncbi:hypothetical protein ACFE04_027734 [Oxalis oulophora]